MLDPANSSDIERAKRQQQVIQAIRDRILNANMLPQMIVDAPGIWSRMSRTVQSGLSLDQMLRLAVYLKDVPKENIHQGVIEYKHVTPTMWNGASVLIPNRTTLGPLLVDVFGPNYNR
jgi:polyisoprenyl-teichoic acid--peptidoglycan teichoic acid transferase